MRDDHCAVCGRYGADHAHMFGYNRHAEAPRILDLPIVDEVPVEAQVAAAIAELRELVRSA